MAEFTERELKIAARMIRNLRRARTMDEAINVVAIVAKVLVEREPHAVLLPDLRR